METCIVCGREFDANPVGFYTRHGYVCMAHEGETMVVLEVQHDGGKYITNQTGDIEPLVCEMLASVEVGDTYSITKREMPVVAFYNLPEFDGF